MIGRLTGRVIEREPSQLVVDVAGVGYEVEGSGRIDADIADQALNLLKVDSDGFDQNDRRVLMAMIEMFEGGPVGVESLAAAIGEERDTIEDVIEPFLIQQGLMVRTPRGRVVTDRAYRHFGLSAKAAPPSESRSGASGDLFNSPEENQPDE